ncbi:MAG: hypothetical protein R2849_18895 [Thermomicrobiales bacterium]
MMDDGIGVAIADVDLAVTRHRDVAGMVERLLESRVVPLADLHLEITFRREAEHLVGVPVDDENEVVG